MGKLSTDAKVGLIVGAVAVPVGIALVLAMGLYFAFASGFVMAKLWQWHAVPLGLPQIDWTAFAAAMLGISLLRGPVPDQSKPEDDKWVKTGRAIGHVVAPWFALAIGWWLT